MLVRAGGRGKRHEAGREGEGWSLCKAQWEGLTAPEVAMLVKGFVQMDLQRKPTKEVNLVSR